MASAKRSIKTVGLVVKRERPEAVTIARILTALSARQAQDSDR